jgi:Fe-S cluster assembly protein SufB
MNESPWLAGYRSAAKKTLAAAGDERSRYVSVNYDLSAAPRNGTGRPHMPENVQAALSDRTKIAVLQVDNAIVSINVPAALTKQGLVISNLLDVRENMDDLFSKPEKKYDAYNAACFRSGIFVSVPDGMKIDVPVNFFVFVTAGASVVGRTLVVAGSGSAFKIDEYCLSDAGDASYNNVTELHVGNDACVGYTAVQNFGKNVINVTKRRALIGRSSRIDWVVANLGAAATISTRDTVLAGEQSAASDAEIFFGDNDQQFDLSSNMHHVVPRTGADVVVRGILRDSSRSVSRGMVTIAKDAQKTDTRLSEHTLMLDPATRSNAIPGLEIEANDVKASHSASTSHIDDESLFYLMSRGLDESSAKRLVALGFLSAAFEKIPADKKKMLRKMITEKWDMVGV